MIRPAHVFHVIEASGSGGTEVYVESLARFLRGHSAQTIVTLSGTQAEAEARFPTSKVHAVNGLVGMAGMLRHLPAGALIQFHLYSRLFPAMLAACALRRRGFRCLITLHQPLANWSWRHRIGWRLAVRMADGVVCVSGAVMQDIERCKGTRPARVIAGPLPDALLTHEITAKPARTGPFRVVGAGRLAPEKGWETLIAAMKTLPDAELAILGDGPLRAALQACARDAEVAISMPGRLDQADLFATMRNADVFVLPSRFEGLGLAAIEAMALGLPVVTADFRAAQDYIVPGRTGFSFPAGDAEALAEQLRHLRANPDLRSCIGAAGAAHARARFTPEAQFGQYPALFDEIARCAS